MPSKRSNSQNDTGGHQHLESRRCEMPVQQGHLLYRPVRGIVRTLIQGESAILDIELDPDDLSDGFRTYYR
jgi:hypothetical protein